jgi:hypothetical protein
MISLVLTACLALALTQSRPQNNTPELQPHPHSTAGLKLAGCGSSSARENRASAPLLGGIGAYQHVQVLRSGGRTGHFGVAYSAKTKAGSEPCNERVNNALISVFELSPADPSGSDVLIYGTGYGCRFLSGGTCDGAQYQKFGAATDAANVDSIVRRCMQRAGTIKIDVVVPHSHADHINPEFLHALEALDYKVQAIMTHADDYNATMRVDTSTRTACGSISRWDSLSSLIQPYGTQSSTPCLQTVCITRREDSPLTYKALTGDIWMRERGGHTPGASDLVLDVGGDPSRRILIYGSAPPGTGPSTTSTCMAPICNTTLTGVRQTILAHGNVRFQ